jgi:hypothetical protein
MEQSQRPGVVALGTDEEGRARSRPRDCCIRLRFQKSVYVETRLAVRNDLRRLACACLTSGLSPNRQRAPDCSFGSRSGSASLIRQCPIATGIGAKHPCRREIDHDGKELKLADVNQTPRLL